MLAVLLENGLIPGRQQIKEATDEGRRYHYLRYLTDSNNNILFKYLDPPAPGKEYQMLAEFEADSKSQAIANLYLSA